MATPFQLIPDPTFTATVSLPRPGLPDADVAFTFRHLSEEDRFALDDEAEARATELRRLFGVPDDVDAAISAGDFDMAAHKKYLRALRADRPARLLHVVSGWGLADEFTTDNLRTLLSNYPAAFDAIMTTYRNEVDGARAKN